MRYVKVNSSKDAKGNFRKAHIRKIQDRPTPTVTGVGLFDVPVERSFNDSLQNKLVSFYSPYFDGPVPEEIEHAVEFARLAHGNQVRKYSGEPYIFHPVEVSCFLMSIDEEVTLEEVQSCILHDVVEDTNVLLEDVFVEFGDIVGDNVRGLTDVYLPDGVNNRAVRKKKEAERLWGESKSVQKCKFADICHNSASILKEDPNFAKIYLKEKQYILEGFDKLPSHFQEIADNLGL